MTACSRRARNSRAVTRTGSKAARPAGFGNRIAPFRFILFLALFLGGYVAYRVFLPVDDWRDGVAIAFDAAAIVFIVSLAPLLRSCSVSDMRRHAERNDANRVLVLVLTTLLTLVVMAAITGEMKGAQAGEMAAITTLVGTLLAIWLFANSMYALHYAHSFYAQDLEEATDLGGLDFPETPHPDYWDFAYFAFTLGMTFQTSDVGITSRYIRKVALAHCFAAFVFNIGVIAFTINVLGGSS